MPENRLATRPRGPAGGDGHQHQQREDLQQRSNPEGQPQAVSGPDPTAIEVRHHPEELVEEEQKGDLEGGVAELAEMEHHQHPQGTIGEREGPVIGGDDAVLLQGGELPASSSTTWQVRSAMRQLWPHSLSNQAKTFNWLSSTTIVERASMIELRLSLV